MKRLIAAGIFILILSLIFHGWNFFRLKMEWEKFCNHLLIKEKNQAISVVEAALASGGDPIEALLNFLEEAQLLKAVEIKINKECLRFPEKFPEQVVPLGEVEIPPLKLRFYYTPEILTHYQHHLLWEFLLGTILSLLTGGGMVILIILYHRERIRYEREKAETERIKSINLVISAVLHEVKNALNNIQMLTYRLKRKKIEGAKILESEIQRIDRQLRELSIQLKPRLNNKLLKIDQLIEEVVEEFRESLYRDGITVVLKLNEGQLLGDQDKLKSVIRNLIKNAYEVLREDREKKLEIIGKISETNYVLQIIDSAGKLPPPEKLFKPFFTEKPGGFGLGLFLSKKFIEAHNGTLKAYKNNQNTVFEIKLPLGKISEK